MSHGPAPGAVILGGYINGLGIVRSLAARGIPTAVVCTTPHDIAQRSRWVSAHDSAFGIEDHPELLVELLLRRAPVWRGWALFPANDGALAAVSQYREELSAHYTVIAPGWEATRCCLDKDLMLDAARAAGMSVPVCYGPAEASMASREDLSFPVIVKPVQGFRFLARFGCKVFLARDREELASGISRANEAQIACRVYDVIPGPDSQIYAYCTYIDGTGEPSTGLTVRKIRQSPPFFGVARVADVAGDIQELRDSTVEMLRRMKFRGIAAAEFKRDPRDGSFRFMEVNGRSVIYNGLLRKAGLDLAALAWSDYVIGRPEPDRSNGWPGVWINLHADLAYSAWNHRNERLGFADFLSPYGRPVIEAVWSAVDPLPFLTQWSRTCCAVARGLSHGRFRELIRSEL